MINAYQYVVQSLIMTCFMSFYEQRMSMTRLVDNKNLKHRNFHVVFLQFYLKDATFVTKLTNVVSLGLVVTILPASFFCSLSLVLSSVNQRAWRALLSRARAVTAVIGRVHKKKKHQIPSLTVRQRFVINIPQFTHISVLASSVWNTKKNSLFLCICLNERKQNMSDM